MTNPILHAGTPTQRGRRTYPSELVPSEAPIHQIEPQFMQRKCGHCSTGPAPHPHCPGVITNGNGIVLHCPCRCRSIHCRSCQGKPEDVGEIDPIRWRCLDTAACGVRVADAREAVRAKLLGPKYKKPETNMKYGEALDETPKPARKPARAKTGVCQCGCGGATRGGRFLPGHDAKLKSALAITRNQSDDRAKQVLAAAEEIARNWLKNPLVDEALEAEARSLIERTGGDEEFVRKATKARNQANGVVDLNEAPPV